MPHIDESIERAAAGAAGVRGTGGMHTKVQAARIATQGGTHERIHADPSGEPNSFPSDQAMTQKFLQLARPVLDGRAQAFADAMLSLERFDRVAAATELAR